MPWVAGVLMLSAKEKCNYLYSIGKEDEGWFRRDPSKYTPNFHSFSTQRVFRDEGS